MRKRYIPSPTGEELKRQGMAVAAAAAPNWFKIAMDCIRAFAATGNWFTSEDVTDKIGLPRGGVLLHRNNAVGAAFSYAARKGIIVRVSYEKSRRPVSHAHVMAVWVGRRRTIPVA